MNKTLLIVLIIVVLAGGGYLAWQYLPTGEPAIVENCVEEGGHIEGKIDGSNLNGSCCVGLNMIMDSEWRDDLNECKVGAQGGFAGYTCTYCGNGECGLGENQCNCPGDCKIEVDWQSLLPGIKEAVGLRFGSGMEEMIVNPEAIQVYSQQDITGDGVDEAVINPGVPGGAYTLPNTFIRLEVNQPALVQFKKQDGSIGPLLFIDGASAGNGASIGMLPTEQIVYQGHWSISVNGEPFGALTDCRIEAYKWNEQIKTFEYSQDISNTKRQDYCLEVESKMLRLF